MANAKEPQGKSSAVGKKVRYKALVSLNYKGKRVEAGELVEDLPEVSVDWLLAGGHIEKEGK